MVSWSLTEENSFVTSPRREHVLMTWAIVEWGSFSPWLPLPRGTFLKDNSSEKGNKSKSK